MTIFASSEFRWLQMVLELDTGRFTSEEVVPQTNRYKIVC